MSLKKQYLKTRAACRVTFSLPKKAAAFANTVHLVGDFNDWNKSITPMKRLKNGSFTTTLVLRRNKEYQFRYLLDGLQWENDWKADKYVPNRYGSENSVVVVLTELDSIAIIRSARRKKKAKHHHSTNP